MAARPFVGRVFSTKKTPLAVDLYLRLYDLNLKSRAQAARTIQRCKRPPPKKTRATAKSSVTDGHLASLFEVCARSTEPIYMAKAKIGGSRKSHLSHQAA